MLGTQTEKLPVMHRALPEKNPQQTPKQQVKERTHSSEDAFIYGRGGYFKMSRYVEANMIPCGYL